MRRRSSEDSYNSTIQALNELNPDVGIQPVTAPGFLAFGRLYGRYRADALAAGLHVAASVHRRLIHEPSALTGDRSIRENLFPYICRAFGGLESLQIGWIGGRNKKCTMLEYHKCPQLVLAYTEMLMLLGHSTDIQMPAATYDLSLLNIFYVPRGTIFEIHPLVLHGLPIHLSEEEGFLCVEVHPEGTNDFLKFDLQNCDAGPMLSARNRWVITHPSDHSSNRVTTHGGLRGRSIKLRTF
jgi:hypothetical protein